MWEFAVLQERGDQETSLERAYSEHTLFPPPGLREAWGQPCPGLSLAGTRQRGL